MVKKIENDKKVESDIGLVDELFELCKNLSSMEAHAIGSYNSTKDEKWLEVKEIVRSIRTKYLSMIVKKNDGQLWCFSKHSCEACMRLEECSARFLSTKQLKSAKSCLEDYRKIIKLFLLLNDFGGENVSTNAKSSA